MLESYFHYFISFVKKPKLSIVEKDLVDNKINVEKKNKSKKKKSGKKTKIINKNCFRGSKSLAQNCLLLVFTLLIRSN